MERPAEGRRCRGCDSVLPEKPAGQPGRTRLYCTKRCQQRTWEREAQPRGECRDCGVTLGQNSHYRGNERCRPCLHKLLAAEREEALTFVEWMWNEGRPVREMAEELGWVSGNVGPYLDALRKAGRIGYRYKAYEQRAA